MKLLLVSLFLLAKGCDALPTQASIKSSAENPPRIFVSTTKEFNGSTSSVLSVSTDGGNNFRIQTATSAIFNIYALDNKVFLGNQGGLLSSTDSGTTWVNHFFNFMSVVAVYARGNEVFAAGDRFLYSSDNGQTWNSNPLDQISGNALYAVGNKTFFGTDQNGLYCSDDFGKTWKHVIGNEDVLSISGFDNTIVASGNEGVYMSFDGGETWAHRKIPGVGVIMSVGMANGKIYLGCDFGLIIANDLSEQWELKTTKDGLLDNIIFSVGVAGDYVVVGTRYGISISSDGGSTWVSKTQGTTPGLAYTQAYPLFVQSV